MKPPEDIEATEGNSIEFYCSVDGKPRPTITWKKDGSIIKNSLNDSVLKKFHYEFYLNNQRLKINDLNITRDSGIYECSANNSVNTVRSSAELVIRQASWFLFL